MFEQKIRPMLAYSSPPFDSPEHIFEVKWDGTRCILFSKRGEVRLQNRRLLDITYRYPDLQGLWRRIRAKEAILDGELVVLEEGRPSFEKLQQREHISDPLKIELLSERLPATYIAFDLLFLEGEDFTSRPLTERRRHLDGIIEEGEGLILSRFVEERGTVFLKEVVSRGLEGVMAKEKGSPYLVGKRSRHWLKIKPRRRAICHIMGYSRGKGEREGIFGSLLLATREEGRWVYRGRVGSGFSAEEMQRIHALMKGLEVSEGVLKVDLKGARWVKPHLRCEVLYQELTPEGRFRAPVFLRLLEGEG